MRRPRLVPDNTKIPFFRYRWIAFAWSVFVLVGTIALVGIWGLNLGIDFKGGVLLEVRTKGPADLALMRSTLGEVDLGEVSLQTAGSDDQVMIRAKAPEGDEVAQREAVERIKGALDQALGSGLTYQRAEFVGPRVSQELLINSVWAVLVSLLGVLVYLWFRFEWQYGVGAIASLIHDVSASIGIYALSGLEFNLTSIAALLTIVGYSLNDTVVIYDRVRENLRRYKALPLDQLLDRSINETLARTLMTSLTTLLALDRPLLLRRRGDPRLHHHHDLGRDHRHLLDDLHRDAGALLPQPAHRRRRQAEPARGAAAGALRAAALGDAGTAFRARPAGPAGLPRRRVHRVRRAPCRLDPGLAGPDPALAHPGMVDLDLVGLEPVRLAQPMPDILIVGTGADFALFPPALRQAIRAWGPVVEAMATPAACRTYNVLLAEERRVAAALIALPG